MAKAPRKPARKHQPSTIDRLPDEIQEQIAKLRREGRTITEIHDHLKQLDVPVSRSAIGRHVKSMAEIGEEMRESEAMARFLVHEFGEETDERIGRANLRMLQGSIMQLITKRPLDEDGQPVQLDAAEAKELSLALQRLFSAQRVNSERQLRERREFEKAAAAKLDQAVAAGEVDADAVARAKRIMGFEEAA